MDEEPAAVAAPVEPVAPAPVEPAPVDASMEEAAPVAQVEPAASEAPAAPAAPAAPVVPAAAAADDAYSYEAEQERDALHKTLHKPMKIWYKGDAGMKAAHGSFPLFWQDLKDWGALKEVYKLYLVSTGAAPGTAAAAKPAAGAAGINAKVPPAAGAVPKFAITSPRTEFARTAISAITRTIRRTVSKSSRSSRRSHKADWRGVAS